MANFCKNEECPTSQELLDFHNGDLELDEGKLISKHIVRCEFCAAEVEFYSHYPQADEVVEPAEIPKPLHQLAEALLTAKKSDSKSLDALLNDSEDFSYRS